MGEIKMDGAVVQKGEKNRGLSGLKIVNYLNSCLSDHHRNSAKRPCSIIIRAVREGMRLIPSCFPPQRLNPTTPPALCQPVHSCPCVSGVMLWEVRMRSREGQRECLLEC